MTDISEFDKSTKLGLYFDQNGLPWMVWGENETFSLKDIDLFNRLIKDKAPQNPLKERTFSQIREEIDGKSN